MQNVSFDPKVPTRRPTARRVGVAPICPQAASKMTAVLKHALFDHLLHRCYIKLAPSRIAGVGVRAVCDIPPNTDPFVSPNAHLQPPEPPCIAVREDEIAAFPAEVRSQLLSFFAVSSHTLELLSAAPSHTRQRLVTCG